MNVTRIRVPQILPFAILACVALVPAGCGSGEDVNSYKVPKTTEKGKKDLGAEVEASEYRLLGLMIPADNPVWFFKYNGPADVISKYEADFDKLAASIEYGGQGAPQFTPPEGWQKGPGRDSGFVKVFATVKQADGKQEMTITQSGGGVAPNLDRWVKMIGLKPSSDDETKYTTVIDGKGVKVRRVDLRGSKNPTTNPGAGMGMPAGHP